MGVLMSDNALSEITDNPEEVSELKTRSDLMVRSSCHCRGKSLVRVEACDQRIVLKMGSLSGHCLILPLTTNINSKYN